MIARHTPEFFKKSYRLLKYKNERRKFVREFAIRKKQDQQIRDYYNPSGEKLIVFIVPGGDPSTGKDKITGGTISIVSLCEETAAMKDIHGAQTIMCTINGDYLLLRHTMFENETRVYRFEQLADYFQQLQSVIFHIPEYLVSHFRATLNKKDTQWMGRMKQVHINVMNQNIRLMPEPAELNLLKDFASSMTITTAHQKYCTAEYRNLFGIPIHKFSVWISPEQYQFRQWQEKKNLLVVSPDAHPMKEEILQLIKSISGLEVRIIQNLTYKAYKELIAEAKWSLTFGEGLDGYLIEPVFSGAVGFAIYNEQFFTPDFKSFETLYDSAEEMRQKIVSDIQAMDNPVLFQGYQQKQFDLCAKYYSKEQYRKNIAAFYRKEYTYA